MNYSLWIRRPQFTGDQNEWDDQPVWVQIRNPRGEVVSEQQQQTDGRGTVAGLYQLPADALLGDWSVVVSGNTKTVRQIQENGQIREIMPNQSVDFYAEH